MLEIIRIIEIANAYIDLINKGNLNTVPGFMGATNFGKIRCCSKSEHINKSY